MSLLLSYNVPAGSAAVANVGDMHEAVEAALGVSEEAAVAVNVVVDDDRNSRKRYRTKAEDDEAADGKPAKRNVPSHEDQLAARRHKDRQRYASMTCKSYFVYWGSVFIACGSIVAHALSEPGCRCHFLISNNNNNHRSRPTSSVQRETKRTVSSSKRKLSSAPS
jgi:hypothetical protein